MSDQNLEIIHKIIIPVPLDQVWDFLLTDENMKTWFDANEFIIDSIEGGKIEIPLAFGAEEVTIEGEIGLVQPKKKFVFTWLERNQFGEAWFNNTSIAIELENVADGTYCKFTHEGFKYLPADEQVDIFNKYAVFWEEKQILPRLKTLIGAKT
jgi:uncharacterized protein YndB with AHSA1/START domain